jgi:hypothetical protein
MKLTLAVVSCNQDLFDSTCWHAAHYAAEPFELVGLGNGVALRPDPCTVGFSSHRIESLEDNIGVPAALHRLWEMSRSDAVASALDGAEPADHVIAYLHDDLRVYEKGWDVRIKNAFAADRSILLAGFAGTAGLGHGQIYKIPYHLTQLSRQGPMLSNLELHAEFHGERVTENRQVAFVDGFALMLRQSFLDQISGWSWWPFDCVHHAYDYGIACMARRHGGKTLLVPVRCDHGVPDKVTHTRHAGTSSTDHYRRLADKYGGDAAVHAKGHQFVYDTFRDVLPINV